jgi:ATP-dependent helicase HrpB
MPLSALSELVAMDLPLAPFLPELLRLLRGGRGLVLKAEPGAGKTSLAPLAVALELGRGGLPVGRVLVLEPRRIAALQSAWRAAELLGETPGRRVGYRVRGDSRPGALLEFLTEGVFIRMIQEDPGLAGTACVVFDEFHERSIAADLSLALALEARGALRPDLPILLMSATLAAGELASHLGSASLEVPGRSYPVATRHLTLDALGRSLGRGGFEEGLASAALGLLDEIAGDILVFLPGRAEIGRLALALEARLGRGREVEVLPLHGSLPLEAQRRVVVGAGGAPGAAREGGRRRIILATSVAETSLTVPGIEAVIDSGLARLTRYEARTGLNRLVTEREAQDRADQRRGRAGRLGPGLCLRAWPAGEILPERTEPEILRAELSGIVLEALVWGARRRADLPWLDEPPEAAWETAAELLRELGAMDGEGRATAFGRACARLGTEARLAALALRGAEAGRLADAAALAALLASRGGGEEADLALALEALRRGDPAFAAARDEARRLEDLLRAMPGWKAAPSGAAADQAGRGASIGSLLAPGFPDRIARRVDGRGPEASFQLPGGRRLAARGALAAAEWIVAAEADSGATLSRGGGPKGPSSAEGVIYAGAALEEEEALAALAPLLVEAIELEWEGLAPRARSRRRAGAILLSERPVPLPSLAQVSEALAAKVEKEGVEILPWDEGLGSPRALLARMRWYARTTGNALWPELSDRALASTALTWLCPYIEAKAGKAVAGPLVTARGLAAALEGLVPSQDVRAFARLAPARLELPSGRSVLLDYAGAAMGPGGLEGGPVLEAKPQDFYGLSVHPSILGRPVLIRLLSPAGRPIQVTADLPGFWRGAWQEARKELRSAYPRHEWPENPALAQPSLSSIKKRPRA